MLNDKFSERMKSLLADEYDAFALAIEEEDAVRGLRVNTKAISAERIATETALPLSAIPYCEAGFILNSDEPMGTHPLHHAGAVYMQDPGAMSAVEAVDINPDFWIIDLCAAPGGKSTQAAAKLGDGGFILSNEFVPKRAKILVSNLERLGVKGAMVTSLDTAKFKDYFRGAFDLCILDAPCSGEGMFRKNSDAIEMWSAEAVSSCAKRQREIIENAAPLVKSGGYLLYSTCTYSLEENEMLVDEFLRDHGEYTLVPVSEKVAAATAPGVAFDGCIRKDLHLTRRFYPHKSRGEGQFVALMKKVGISDRMSSILYKDSTKPLKKEEISAINEFFKNNLDDIPEGRLARYGENIVLIPHECPILPYGVFSAGVLVGTLARDTLIPSHHFYSAYGKQFKRRLDLSAEDDRLRRYLKGEQIPTNNEIGDGFAVVTHLGCTVGGGKSTGGALNNHYPKGLRNK